VIDTAAKPATISAATSFLILPATTKSPPLGCEFPASLLRIEDLATRLLRDPSMRGRAGFASRTELLASLRPEGRLYRIEFHRTGEDPLAVLRRRARIGKAECAELDQRLAPRGRAYLRGP
jgi:hypothetical protein